MTSSRCPRGDWATHRFAWRNNPRRAQLYGQRCRILASGSLGSVLVEWENGSRDIVSRRALRRVG